MVLKIKHLLLLLLSAHLVLCDNNEPIPGNECPRFSVNEFYISLFQPLFQERMVFVQDLLKASTDGVEEMLVKMEEKKGNDGAITKLGKQLERKVQQINELSLAALNGLREMGMLAIHKVKFAIEHMWRSELEHARSLEDYRKLFINVLEMLNATERDLIQAFAEMVVFTQPIIDPAVQVLIKLIESKPAEEQGAVKVKLKQLICDSS